MPYVQLYLDRGDGPGMVRLAIYRDNLGGDPAPGTVELTEIPDNCVQNQMVTVHHRGGLQVNLMISTCLVWDPKGTLPAPPVLSVKEATEIAAQPESGGRRLPAELRHQRCQEVPDAGSVEWLTKTSWSSRRRPPAGCATPRS